MSERNDLVVKYDDRNDVLYVSLGAPRPGYGEQDEEMENLILRYDDDDQFMGYTVLRFSKTNCIELERRLLTNTGARIPVPCFAD